jgi:adhesin/invasin
MRQLWLDTSGVLPIAGETQSKISLSWRDTPRDLDLYVHLATAEGEYLVHYGQLGNLEGYPWAKLDRDVRNGFGPETITIRHWVSGEYRCAVYNYSGESRLAGCGATLELDVRGRQQVFQCPAEGDGRWWLVFDVDTNTGNIEVINQMVDQPWRGYNSTTRIPS